MNKEVHYSVQVEHHSAPFAPCGARVISPQPNNLRPSSDSVDRVTCPLCQKWIRQTVCNRRALLNWVAVTEDYGT